MNKQIRMILSGIAACLCSNLAVSQTNTFPATGNVGIGTTAPASKLDILPANGNAISIRPYGTAANNTGQLQFKELAANGTNYIGFRAPDALASNYIFRLPVNYGTNGQMLTTNGAGVLSWTSGAGASLSLNNLTATAVSQSLRPNTNNTKDLGASTLGWRDLYLSGKIYSGSMVLLKNSGGIALGNQAGNVSTGNYNLFFGNFAGLRNSTGIGNVFIGEESGSFTTIGSGNTFIGYNAGKGNTSGGDNTLLGVGAEVGSGNLTNATAIGSESLVSASNSLVLGNNANVGIGVSAPSARLEVKTNSSLTVPQLLLSEDENDYARLSFSNLGSTSFWTIAGINSATTSQGRLNFYNSTVGDVLSLTGDGNVCIGTVTPATGYKLSVNGKLMCEEMKVQLNANWPDFVFSKDYQLKPLSEIQQFVRVNGHLPGVPSAEEIKHAGGIEVGTMQVLLLEKIEELTLHLVEQERKYDLLQKELNDLKSKRN